MTIIEKIKDEIERRMKESKERLSNIVKAGMVAPNEEQLQCHLAGLLSFLDTIEEKPVDFDKAWEEYGKSKGGGAITFNVKDLARHFYELGRNAK